VRKPVHKTRFSLMYACGLRFGEATALEFTAIDSANLLLRIVGKDNKERRVLLPQPMLDDTGGPPTR
jgi:site-specific recombinase XerD